MASDFLFNLSDKALLIKLHLVAMEKAELNENKDYILVNSGLAEDKKVNARKKEYYDEIAQKKDSQIKMFSAKDGLYEVGIIITEKKFNDKHLKPYESSTQKGRYDPKILYNEMADRKINKADPRAGILMGQLKNEAYSKLVKYLQAFCGEKYANSIPKDKIICEAFSTEDQVRTLDDNGELGKLLPNVIKGSSTGSTPAPSSKANVLFYKIGYSIGAKHQ